MSRGLIAQIKIVVLRDVGQIGNPCAESIVSGPCAALTAIGSECINFDAHRHARMASVAMRAISENSAPAKTVLDQTGIDVCIDQVRGSGNL